MFGMTNIFAVISCNTSRVMVHYGWNLKVRDNNSGPLVSVWELTRNLIERAFPGSEI